MLLMLMLWCSDTRPNETKPNDIQHNIYKYYNTQNCMLGKVKLVFAIVFFSASIYTVAVAVAVAEAIAVAFTVTVAVAMAMDIAVAVAVKRLLQ